MQNRRLCKRRELLFHLPVIDRNTGMKTGYLLDVTAEGIQLTGESEFTVGTILQIRIEGVAGCFEGQYLEVDVQVCWCRRDVNGRTWVAGCRICDEAGRDVERIVEMIVRYTL